MQEGKAEESCEVLVLDPSHRGAVSRRPGGSKLRIVTPQDLAEERAAREATREPRKKRSNHWRKLAKYEDTVALLTQVLHIPTPGGFGGVRDAG